LGSKSDSNLNSAPGEMSRMPNRTIVLALTGTSAAALTQVRTLRASRQVQVNDLRGQAESLMLKSKVDVAALTLAAGTDTGNDTTFDKKIELIDAPSAPARIVAMVAASNRFLNIDTKLNQAPAGTPVSFIELDTVWAKNRAPALSSHRNAEYLWLRVCDTKRLLNLRFAMVVISGIYLWHLLMLTALTSDHMEESDDHVHEATAHTALAGDAQHWLRLLAILCVGMLLYRALAVHAPRRELRVVCYVWMGFVSILIDYEIHLFKSIDRSLSTLTVVVVTFWQISGIGTYFSIVMSVLILSAQSYARVGLFALQAPLIVDIIIVGTICTVIIVVNIYNTLVARHRFLVTVKSTVRVQYADVALSHVVSPWALSLLASTHCLEDVESRHHQRLSVLFCDIDDFMRLTWALKPLELIRLLDVIFTTFDSLSEHVGVRRVDTVGASYLACSISSDDVGVLREVGGRGGDMVLQDAAARKVNADRNALYESFVASSDAETSLTHAHADSAVASKTSKGAKVRGRSSKATHAYAHADSFTASMNAAAGTYASNQNSLPSMSSSGKGRSGKGGNGNSKTGGAVRGRGSATKKPRIRGADFEGAHRLINLAMAMASASQCFATRSGGAIRLRIAVHTGPVLLGVVGMSIPRVHLFGETVTVAQELAQYGVAGRVSISLETRNTVKDAFIVSPLPAHRRPAQRQTFVPRFVVSHRNPTANNDGGGSGGGGGGGGGVGTALLAPLHASRSTDRL
jgi:class 3 adenylate cyclase